MKKAQTFQFGLAFLFSIGLLVFATSCTKEYSLDIRIEPPNSGSVNASPGGGDYEEGTEVILSPVPASGYRFDDWSGSDASDVSNDRIVMSKDMAITANFALQHMIRLTTGSGLNAGAEIYFVALSKNVNYFDLDSDDLFNYNKTDADWYIDGGIIPFTTEYKEFDLALGEYYFMLRAAGLVMITTTDVISGKQTIEIYSDGYGVSIDHYESTKGVATYNKKVRRKVIIRR
jgi:hypothetical protein